MIVKLRANKLEKANIYRNLKYHIPGITDKTCIKQFEKHLPKHIFET